jgi:uncharacterized protein (DUF433 family)
MGDVKPVNPLATGFYTVGEATRLIEVGNGRRILAWLRGYPARQIGPLLTRDYAPINGSEELSFLDLMEVRFVEHFREQGVKVRTLRRAMENARQIFGVEKPLATDRIRFVAAEDRKDIFVEEVLMPAARAADDARLWSLLTRQYEIYEFIQEKLAHGVSFDPRTHLASRWTPRPERFPDIVIDPRIAYGQPVGPSLVPTRTLWDAWRAEDEDINAVADWFAMPVHEAQQAVEFERSLSDSRQAMAA